ncbi:potassium channel family protein [Natrialba asiatica]|uniref:TrkA-C domain-containing protein n=1 Tax=Natrialba asiatica (strain ATCC 700177 / DSM 12278 / JCM 9576 / FERM P-10747 / NBRC 102637 / 172P1) TaxID=29540 RepID=M0B6I7_NATA1|nr:NAD-binding protein [Natrialba asiatica]ELZ05264.1 TrkA-C domain-containing protein [Natrialba asiatica DSM 12278]
MVGLGIVVLFYTLVYNWGMHALENRPQSIFRSFQTVIETMTTTGFGADSPWTTPTMNILLVTIQLTGVVIGFVALRVLVIPLFEQTPLNLASRLTSKTAHVVIAEYQRDTDILLDELEEFDIDYVLIESDEEEAKRLSDDGYQAINGDPEDRADLDRATIERASLLITDAGDKTASIVLTALEANKDLRVISFTGSTRHKAALAEIGVDRSVAPHALIGRRLAEKATTPVTVGEQSERDEIDIREILVRRNSPLHGVRVRDSPIANHPNLTLVAGWFDGELRLPPSPDDELTPNTVLTVAGPENEIGEMTTEIGGVRPRRIATPSRVVVAGVGEGGTAAVDALPADVSVTTVDESEGRNPDVVGDVTEPETLREAGINDASALIVTVDDDSTALMAIAVARSLSSGVEILARVTDGEKTRAAFRAGADYVLSIQRVSARLVASEVHGERIMDPVSQIRLVRADAAPFVGQTVAEARRDTERGWTVIGVSRNGTVHTDERTDITADDDVFVAGSDEAIQEFERTVADS